MALSVGTVILVCELVACVQPAPHVLAFPLASVKYKSKGSHSLSLARTLSLSGHLSLPISPPPLSDLHPRQPAALHVLQHVCAVAVSVEILERRVPMCVCVYIYT